MFFSSPSDFLITWLPAFVYLTIYRYSHQKWTIQSWNDLVCWIYFLILLFFIIFCPQGGQHQHPQQPAVQDGAVRQQPGEPGGGAHTSLPGGEEESRKPALSDFTTVRSRRTLDVRLTLFPSFTTKPPIKPAAGAWLLMTVCQLR